jgi:hypothetical protein
MNFHVGEKVVYPNQGVGIIENISMRSFGSRPERFYLLRLASDRLTVMVPFSHVEDVGLRKVTRNGQVERVLRFLASGECQGRRDWKNRFAENSEKRVEAWPFSATPSTMLQTATDHHGPSRRSAFNLSKHHCSQSFQNRAECLRRY